MDAVALSIGAGPLALYLFYLGAINLGRRPRLTNGAREVVVLAVAISGLVFVGPMQLFMPEAAAARFGPYVWIMLVSFYGLCVTLCVLLGRPRLIIYNITSELLRPVLAEVASQLDTEARWAGEALALPQLGVQLHVECYGPMRNISLAASGDRQSFSGWNRLERGLATALAKQEVAPNPRGFTFLTVGLLMLGYPTWLMVTGRELVAQKLWEMLRL